MKILFIKPLEHVFRVECHTPEDMVFVSTFIHAGDLVSGETDRSIKPKEQGQKPFRLKMYLTLRASSVEVEETSPSLRVSGSIESGSPAEFVELHAQHALVFNLFQSITVKRERLFPHEIERLRAFEKESQRPLYLGIVLDDEEAHVLQVSSSGLKELGKINAFRSGKQFKSDVNSEMYFAKLAEIVWTSPLNTIIIAGPGFTREGLLAYLKERAPKRNPKQFLSVATNNVGEKGIREALSAASVTKALGESLLARESELVQEVLKQLGKNSGLAIYGMSEVERAVKAGAAHTVLVSSGFLSANREKVNVLLDLSRQMGILCFVVEERHEHGKQLAGLGGVVALLRYAFES